MAKPFQFTFLLELAIDKRDTAASAMRDARVRLEGAIHKQQEIENYRNEYRERHAESGRHGVSIHQWQDFRLFLGKLDMAVEQMQGEILRCEQGLEVARQAWLACEKDVKAFETLQVRHEQREMQRENKREQAGSDEWVSNRFASDKGSSSG